MGGYCGFGLWQSNTPLQVWVFGPSLGRYSKARLAGFNIHANMAIFLIARGNKELWEYQAGALKMWVGMADGFHCDVAPLAPLEFRMKARKEVTKVNPVITKSSYHAS